MQASCEPLRRQLLVEEPVGAGHVILENLNYGCGKYHIIVSLTSLQAGI